jgi:L-fucose isomerase-like protein
MPDTKVNIEDVEITEIFKKIKGEPYDPEKVKKQIKEIESTV